MNNTNNHMIKRVYWHAGLPGRKEAIDLQNRISDWSNNKLPALSTMVLDQLSAGNSVICIPTLELDLGHISLANLEQELNEVFAHALKEALTHHMMSNSISDPLKTRDTHIVTEAQRQADILISFFEHGYLPWNYSEKMGTVTTMVEYVLINESGYFADTLRDHARTKKQITKRIARQLPDELLAGILAKTIPGNATEILAYKQQTERIHKEEKKISLTETELNIELWNWILDYVFTEHTSTFNRKTFMRGMIRKIAARQNVDYYALLNLLDTAVHKISKIQKVHSDFLKTFELIRTEDLNTEKNEAKEESAYNYAPLFEEVVWAILHNNITSVQQLTTNIAFCSWLYKTSEDELQNIAANQAFPGLTGEQSSLLLTLLAQIQTSIELKGISATMPGNTVKHIWRVIKDHIIRTNGQQADLKNGYTFETEQMAGSTSEHKWLILTNYLTGNPYFGSKDINLKSLITELSKLDKKRLTSLIKHRFKTEDDEKQILEKFDNIPIDELTTLLYDTPPVIPGQIADLMVNALRDAGIYIAPANVRNIYLGYFLQTTTEVADEAALLKYMLTIIAKQANKTVAQIAACVITESYKYALSPFANHALDEIKGIYKQTINEIPEHQINRQIEKLLSAVKNKATDNDASRALLQIIAATRPRNFYDCLVSADKNTMVETIVLIDTDTLLFILDSTGRWPAKLSATLTRIKNANENSATIPALINDITMLAFRVLREQGKSEIPIAQNVIVAAVESKSLTEEEYVEQLCATRTQLKIFLTNDINQNDSLLQLNELTAGWVAIVAEKTGLSEDAVEKSLAKLIESFWRKHANGSTWDGDISELTTEVLLHFRIKGERAQQLLEITRISTRAATKDETRNKKAQGFDELSLITDKLLKPSTNTAEQLHPDIVQAVQIFAEQYPLHSSGFILKMDNDNLARISNSSVSFSHYCQALSIGNANAHYILRLSTHYNFFKALIWQGMPQSLKLEYWICLRALLNSNKAGISYLTDLTKAAVQVFANMPYQNKDEITRAIKNNFGCIPAWLKTILPGVLVPGIQQNETPDTQETTSKYMDETDSSLAAPLLHYHIKRMGVPSQALQDSQIHSVQELIERYPFALHTLLKYYSLTDNELLWLYNKIGFSSLSNAISSVAPGTRGQLAIAGLVYNAFVQTTTSKQLKYIFWKIIADAWINNKLITLSPMAVWQSILQKGALLYNISYKKIIEEIQTIKYKLPPAYKSSFENLSRKDNINRKPPKNEKVSKQAELISETGILVNNAGMVLLNNYIRLLFDRLKLTVDNKFVSKDAQEKAVHCLQFLCTGQLTTSEHLLPLNKVMCGIDIKEPISTSAEILHDEQQLMEGLINNMIAHWPQCGCSTTDGFRGTWFLRNGIVKKHEKKWNLVIDKNNRKPYDMLLNSSPFTFSVINYPWMEFPLYVDWITN
jgi:hypothetical protein